MAALQFVEHGGPLGRPLCRCRSSASSFCRAACCRCSCGELLLGGRQPLGLLFRLRGSLASRQPPQFVQFALQGVAACGPARRCARGSAGGRPAAAGQPGSPARWSRCPARPPAASARGRPRGAARSRREADRARPSRRSAPRSASASRLAISRWFSSAASSDVGRCRATAAGDRRPGRSWPTSCRR